MYSRLLTGAAVLGLCVPNALAGPRMEHRRSSAGDDDESQQRADAVKEAFQFAWDGYYEHAFPNDELHPVSNSYSNSRNGWGASAVDAFSTAIVMGNEDVTNTILEFISTINFGQPDSGSEVSLFETTIRYLGGLLSGYDLLSGPLSHLTTNSAAVDQVLVQAQHLANNLSFAFDTPSGIPSNNLYFDPQGTDGSTSNGLATIGTLVLEWTRLSDLTNNQTYATLSQQAESYLLSPKPASSEPFPGLVGTNVNISNGVFLDANGGWVGGVDSFYEYLIKMYVYDPVRFATYKDRWVLAADSTIEFLASHPSTRPNLTFTAAYKGKDLIFESQHLACFNGGNFILGGLVLDEQKYIDFGLDLVHGCEETYARDATKIGPEAFRWITDTTPADDTNNPGPSPDQEEFYNEAGFYITSSGYALRPEVIESFYYAYRATGDQVYRDWAWNAFVAINATCRVGSGFAELNNVNEAGGGGYNDFQDSFLFAEVLKYSYLIHAADDVFQVSSNETNQFVYNTEAHPIKVAGTST